MALGKPVVATDFSGSRDFLDSSCGYPVKAFEWTLSEDHGHYLAGHSWGGIDEDALTETLKVAASKVDEGDHSIGIAARNNIANKLSYDAVANSIKTSIDNMFEEDEKYNISSRSIPKPQPLPDFRKININNGPEFSSLEEKYDIIPVFLNNDLSFNSNIPDRYGKSEWFIFAPKDARADPNAMEYIRSAIISRPDVSVFYSDDVADNCDAIDQIRLKPDFDPILLASQDYIGVPIIAKASLVHSLGGLDKSQGSAAIYDFVVRASEKAVIARIPHVLLGHNHARVAARQDQRVSILKRSKIYADYEPRAHTSHNHIVLNRDFHASGYPNVTLVIPTRRTLKPGTGVPYVTHLLHRIADADWPMSKLTVILGDDVEGHFDILDIDWPFKLRYIKTPRESDEPFNYAKKMNQLWRLSDDEQIIFMNDDVLPLDANWIKSLETFSTDHSVGGVGALLFYENGVFQHAGIFPSLRIAVHAWAGMNANAKTYQNWASAQRQWSMVTGAIFATRRSVMDRVFGFDEKFTLEFNDIDLCLRIRALGQNIIYNPEASFVHAEKASRGDAPPPAEDAALFLSRWTKWLAKDPSSNPSYNAGRMDILPFQNTSDWFY
jgi:hypothetical protein